MSGPVELPFAGQVASRVRRTIATVQARMGTVSGPEVSVGMAFVMLLIAASGPFMQMFTVMSPREVAYFDAVERAGIAVSVLALAGLIRRRPARLDEPALTAGEATPPPQPALPAPPEPPTRPRPAPVVEPLWRVLQPLPQDGSPLSDQVAQRLREAVDAGRFPGGAKVPSDGAIARHFAVSSATVRRAKESAESTGHLLAGWGGKYTISDGARS